MSVDYLKPKGMHHNPAFTQALVGFRPMTSRCRFALHRQAALCIRSEMHIFHGRSGE